MTDFTPSCAVLAKTHVLLESPWGESQESTRTVLHRRAVVLAQVWESALESEPPMVLLLFRLAMESYGIDLGSVEKVTNWRPCLGLPGAPAHLLGVAEVNGEILCIVDPRKLFSLPGSTPADAGHLIVLGKADTHFGLLVDDVEGIRKVARNEIQPAPVFTAAGSRHDICGASRGWADRSRQRAIGE